MRLFFCLSILIAQAPFGASASGGEVIGWGHNLGGQATGSPASSAQSDYETGIVVVGGKKLSNVVAISAGFWHGLALKRDGTVFGWGNNISGEVTGVQSEYAQSRTNGEVAINGKILTDVTAISAGNGYSLGLRSNGTVVAWGIGRQPKEHSQVTIPAGLTNVVAISAGANVSLALEKDGKVIGWGTRKAPENLTNVMSIAAGKDFYSCCLALKRDGTVIEWGPTVPSNDGVLAVSNAMAIAAGSSHYLALLKDGTVWGWGANHHGQATGISSGTNAPKPGLVIIDGRVLTNITAVAAGNDFSLALKANGTVVGWGQMDLRGTPAIAPPGLSNIVAISAGGDFCLALRNIGR